VKALILAGGFGTRLRPLTNTVPKSLLPIANVPFLEHQIRLLAAHGVTETTLLTGYLPEPFDAFVERVAHLGITLEISTEAKPLGTAGAVRSKLEELDGTTVIFNGDILTDLDIGTMLAMHRDRGSLLTIALTQVDDARPYGLVPLGENGRIEAFLEKPADPVAGLINAGTYLIEPRALAEVPADEMWSFETQLFPSLLAAGEPLYGFPADAYWLDIGTPQRYLQAHADVLESRVRVHVEGTLIEGRAPYQHGSIEGPSIVSQPVLVGPKAEVTRSCLGREVMIGAQACVERSVLHDDVRVGVGAVVRDSIIGRGVRVRVGEQLVGAVRA